MPSPNDIERVYGPDTLKIMAMAFDNAHKCLPEKFRGSNKARHKLALLVMRYIERGERDPVGLAELGRAGFLAIADPHRAKARTSLRALAPAPSAAA